MNRVWLRNGPWHNFDRNQRQTSKCTAVSTPPDDALGPQEEERYESEKRTASLPGFNHALRSIGSPDEIIRTGSELLGR